MGDTATPRHKHVRIDQAKLDRAKRALGADTETETVDRALALVGSEDEIERALREVGGRGSLKKLFR